jgi:hypothetical protein
MTSILWHLDQDKFLISLSAICTCLSGVQDLSGPILKWLTRASRDTAGRAEVIVEKIKQELNLKSEASVPRV